MRIGIIGAGASGLMTSILIKEQLPHVEVFLVEAKDRIGKKIMQTGNGKCNIFHRDWSHQAYNQPEFIATLMKNTTATDIISFFTSRGLLLKTDGEGRMYPYSESAKSVVFFFYRLLNQLNIPVYLEQIVESVSPKNNGFTIKTSKKELEADVVVLATGSKASSKEDGANIVSKLLLEQIPLRPGLVALATKKSLAHLQGIKIKCKATIHGKHNMHEDSGEVLFKSNALSGIVIFALSRFYEQNAYITLDLMPEWEKEDIDQYINKMIQQYKIEEVLQGMFPKMIAIELMKKEGNLIQNIKKLRFDIKGPNDFDQAQVVLGGVSINEINADFESKKYPNLYILGEALDVDGASGGYNLGFAWLSAICAAKSIVTKQKG